MNTYENNKAFSYIGDKDTLGGLPVVEQTQAFIAAFKGVISSTPEVIDNSSFFITYLIDKNGNISKISEDSDAENNVTQNFLKNEKVIVRVDQGTLLNPQLNGEHTITSLGSFIPILITQTGSSEHARVSFLNFLNPGQITNEETGETIKSFVGSTYQSSSANPRPTTDVGGNFLRYDSSVPQAFGKSIASSSSTLDLFSSSSLWLTSSRPDPDAATWPAQASVGDNGNTGFYKFTSPLSIFTNLTFRVSFTVYNVNDISLPLTVALVRKRGGSLTKLDSETFTLPAYSITSKANIEVPEINLSHDFSVNQNDIDANDELRVFINWESAIDDVLGGGNGSFPRNITLMKYFRYVYFKNVVINYENSSTQAVVTDFQFRAQSQNPTVPVTLPQPDYFTTGSVTSTVLTASSDLTNEYGNFQTLPTASSDFGFSPINSPFKVKPGDNIRFTFNQDKIFTIFKVLEPPTYDRLYLVLDRPPGSGVNLTNFVLYRNGDDGSFITLDIFKNDPSIGEVDFTGLIIPKYASPELKQNIENIVSKLKQEGIIED